jgi:hypothetical protein
MWAISPSHAFAQDDDLDDLPDDLLDADVPPPVKVRDAALEEEDPDFDFEDDPDWDAGAPPVPVPGGLDEDPSDDLPSGDDDFLQDDPPEDIGPAPAAFDPLDEDPLEGSALSAGSAAPPAAGLGLVTMGKAPLGDHFPAAVVASDTDSLVIELPVLIASKPSDFESDYWLITEVIVDDRKVAESRHLITAESLADMGATVVWSKSHVPVLERDGVVLLQVSKQAGEAGPTALFTKELPYAL